MSFYTGEEPVSREADTMFTPERTLEAQAEELLA